MASGDIVKIIKQKSVQNLVINGGMDFWQRGSVFTNLGNLYMADRWYRFKSGGGGAGEYTLKREKSEAGIPDGLGFERAMLMGRTDGTTDINQTNLVTALTSKDSEILAGKKSVVSFWVKKGSGYSGGKMTSYLGIGAGSNESVIAGWTDQKFFYAQGDKQEGVEVPDAGAGFDITDEWQRFWYYVDIPLNTNQIRLSFSYIPTGTATDDYIYISGVMLHEGSLPRDFIRYGETHNRELEACQRFFCKTYEPDVAPGSATSGGTVVENTGSSSYWVYKTAPLRFPVQMRAIPTMTAYSIAGGGAGSFYSSAGGVLANRTAIFSDVSTQSFTPSCTELVNYVYYHYTADAEL